MTSQAERWTAICQYLNKRFYKPDCEALAISLSAYVAHWSLDDDPVWLFVVGPSGTGKTSIIANSLADLTGAMVLSDLSPSAFISGLDAKLGGSSLLFDLPRFSATRPKNHTQGVLVFKDFTSILSRRPETRAEIIGALREIADGRYSPRKGTKVSEWQGKITVIAAATPAVERAWAMQRDLGERFVQVRWGREDGLETARAAVDQLGNNHVGEFKALITEFIAGTNKHGVMMTTDDVTRLIYPAELTAQLRSHVIRDSTNSKSIVDVSPPESPSRIVKAITQIAKASAQLFGRTELADIDLDRARRVAIDSIPLARLRVFTNVRMHSSATELARDAGMPLTSVEWVLDELLAIGALDEFGSPRLVNLSERFEKLRDGTKAANVIQFPAEAQQ